MERERVSGPLKTGPGSIAGACGRLDAPLPATQVYEANVWIQLAWRPGPRGARFLGLPSTLLHTSSHARAAKDR
ncbi:hypothetical protein D3C71_2017010 [compost metagenome]